MDRKTQLLSITLAILTLTTLARGQDQVQSLPATPASPMAVEPKTGSTAFCLLELPAEGEGRRRWVNLGIVQYLEFSRNELRIYYGGGNLGSGHEARIPLSGPTQLQETLDRIGATAANCR